MTIEKGRSALVGRVEEGPVGRLDYGFVDGKLYVTNFNAYQRDRYKYVGSGLIDCAFEIALQECEGRIQLRAVPDSQGFYFRYGFRALHPVHQEGKELKPK